MTVVEFLGEEPALSLNSSSSSSFVNNEIINYYQRDRSSLLRNRNTKHMNSNSTPTNMIPPESPNIFYIFEI